MGKSKHLMHNKNQIEGFTLAGNHQELDVEFRILEARLNLFIGFSKLSPQLNIDLADCVPFFKTSAPDM